MPPVDELRRRFGVGEFAVRAAIHKLRDEGLFESAGWCLHPVFIDADKYGCLDVGRIVRHVANGIKVSRVMCGTPLADSVGNCHLHWQIPLDFYTVYLL